MGKKTFGKILGIGAIVLGAVLPGAGFLISAVGKVGAAIVGGVVAAGLSAVGSKLVASASAKSAGNAASSGIMVSVQDNVATIPIVYGRRRLAGRQIYVTTSGANNKYLHMVFAIAEGEIQEIERIIFGDNEIAFDGQVTPMTASSGSLAASSARGRFTNRVSVEWRLGTNTQTAFTDLVSSSAGQEGNWTSEHRGLGVAMVHLKFEYDKDKFAQIPQVFFDIKGKKVRTTFGANWASPTTAWSENPAAIALDYLTNTTYGKGLSLDDIDQDSYEETYDYCDELIDLYTEGASAVQGKRYLANGFLDPDTAVFDNIKAVLTPFNGFLVWSAGKYKLKVLKDESILLDVNGEEFTFDESNIIGDISMQMGSKENMANRVKARFYNAGLNYAEDVAIWEDDELRVRSDNGEWLELELSLPFCSDYTRAQMLAKQFMEQSRRGTIVSFNATPDALQTEIGNRVWFSHPYLGFQDDYRVMGLVMNPDKTITVTLQQYDDAIYSVDQIAQLPGPAEQNRNTKFSGADAGIVPAAPTSIIWARLCPGAVVGVDTGYLIDCADVSTGYKNRYSITVPLANISAGTNTITYTAHGFNTGDEIRFFAGLSTIGGLTTNTNYYAIRLDANSFKLALTQVQALAGTFIDITSVSVSGTPQFRRNGELISFNDITSYGFVVQNAALDTKYFYSTVSSIAVPATAWPTGTITVVRAWAIAADSTVGIEGDASYAQQPDPTILCPLLAPSTGFAYQVCDGTAGVSVPNSIGRGFDHEIATGRATLAYGNGTNKWTVNITHSTDASITTQYEIKFLLKNGATTVYAQTDIVAIASGAVAGGTQTYTMSTIMTAPVTWDDPDLTIQIRAKNATQNSAWIDINPDYIPMAQIANDCVLAPPKDLKVWHICDGANGSNAANSINETDAAAGLGSPYTGASSAFVRNRTQHINFRIYHGYNYAVTNGYEVTVSVKRYTDAGFTNLVDTQTFTETVTKSAGATFNTGNPTDYQDYVSTGVINFSTATGGYFVISPGVRGYRTSGVPSQVNTDYSATVTAIANTVPSTDCLFYGPDSLILYQVCDGSSGVSSPGSGTTQTPFTGFWRDVNALIGFKIQHGEDVLSTDNYVIDFSIADDTGPLQSFTQTVARSGTSGFQYVVGSTAIDFSGLVGTIVIGATVKGSRSSGTVLSDPTSVSGTISVATTPSSAYSCAP